MSWRFKVTSIIDSKCEEKVEISFLIFSLRNKIPTFFTHMKVAHYHLGESDTKLAFKYSEFFVKNIMLKMITTIVEISPGGVASLSEFYETLNFGPNANISSLLFSNSKLKRMV